MAKGWITKRNYQHQKEAKKEVSAIKIQSMFRMAKDKKKYKTQRNAIMKAQANVLARQQRRAFKKLQQDNSLAK